MRESLLQVRIHFGIARAQIRMFQGSRLPTRRESSDVWEIRRLGGTRVILRDPVHGLVDFEGIAERVVVALLKAREVQRLRYVRQLGFTSLVFPGAEHSRFAHSLGTAHVMTRLISRLRRVSDVLPVDMQIDEQAEADAVAAALLHDIGHGPFSHLWEELVPNSLRHEQWTEDILLDEDTDVHRSLESLSSGMAGRVAGMLRGQHRLRYLARATSGALDVDRCDYLLRDSHMTGVSYGVYDLDWLLQAFTFAKLEGTAEGDGWVLAVEGRKGLPPVEGFFLARQFMYQQVYHHKATRSAEALIRAILVRLTELLLDGASLPAAPRGFSRAVRGESVSVEDYLSLDDTELLSCFRAWEHCSDATLRELTGRLFSRRLPKTVPLPEGPQYAGLRAEAYERVREIASAAGYRSDLYVWSDNPSDVPYREPSSRSESGLWVQLKHHELQRLGDISFLLGELRNKHIERPRLVFPEEVRTPVEAAIADMTRSIAR